MDQSLELLKVQSWEMRRVLCWVQQMVSQKDHLWEHWLGCLWGCLLDLGLARKLVP